MIVVLLGPTGSGKSVFELEFEKQGLHRVVSTTTRGIREGESTDAYHFVSKEQFQSNIDEDKMVESVTYRDNYYGVAKEDLTKNCVVVVEPNGFYNLKKLYKDEVFAIFLEVSEQERVRRAKSRGDCLKEISERVLEDRQLYTPELLKEVDLVLTDVQRDKIPSIVKKYVSKWKGKV